MIHRSHARRLLMSIQLDHPANFHITTLRQNCIALTLPRRCCLARRMLFPSRLQPLWDQQPTRSTSAVNEIQRCCPQRNRIAAPVCRFVPGACLTASVLYVQELRIKTIKCRIRNGQCHGHAISPAADYGVAHGRCWSRGVSRCVFIPLWVSPFSLIVTPHGFRPVLIWCPLPLASLVTRGAVPCGV
jgi:hypothetical protein